MTQISAVIITYNEERNIERCILSLLGIADEIVVLDSFSTDKTKDICIKHGTRFIQNPFLGHVEQKNKVLEYANYPYVLSLDADEELSPTLKESILKAKENLIADGYYFNRLTNYCGNWIKHSGWYPDQKLRLWNKKKGIWGGMNPHDKVIMEPGTKQLFLKGDLLHFSYYTKEEFTSRIKNYSLISAKSLFLEGRKPSILKLVFAPIWRFIKNYLLEKGILGGANGYIISRTMAQGVYYKYKELFAIYQRNKN